MGLITELLGMCLFSFQVDYLIVEPNEPKGEDYHMLAG